MKVQEFDYPLPKGRIPQYPVRRREQARLMVLDRKDDKIQHRSFKDIVHLISSEDGLVINDTKVMPARLIGTKPTGGKVEVLLLKAVNAKGAHLPPLYEVGAEVGSLWECLIDGRRVREGMFIEFDRGLTGEIKARSCYQTWQIRMRYQGDFLELLEQIGHVPLPPYIKRRGIGTERRIDRRRYQTLFASRSGSIAAPTAGLHFTGPLLKRIKKKGAEIIPITLQIGIGTFFPVRCNQVEDHFMDKEYFIVSAEAARSLREVRERGGKVIAVGTTTVRALETASTSEGEVLPIKGYTGLFIYPGYRFKVVDRLVTNFHLPRSTLLMLVSAFAGNKLVLRAYQVALENKYRFYSYGDAMFIS